VAGLEGWLIRSHFARDRQHRLDSFESDLQTLQSFRDALQPLGLRRNIDEVGALEKGEGIIFSFGDRGSDIKRTGDRVHRSLPSV